MIKNISLMLFVLLVVSSAPSFAKSELSQAAEPVKTQTQQQSEVQKDTPANAVEENSQKAATDANASATKPEDLNFNDSSFTITDEQFEEAKKMQDEVEEKEGLDARIINSSHFTVGTPSKTYMPLNKGK